METVEVTRRSRKFGWGYSTNPTGDDAYSIKVPTSPRYTGTINQVSGAKSEDPYYNKLGVAYNSCWFYNGKRIYAASLDGNDWNQFSIGSYLGLYLLDLLADEIEKLYLQLV